MEGLKEFGNTFFTHHSCCCNYSALLLPETVPVSCWLALRSYLPDMFNSIVLNSYLCFSLSSLLPYNLYQSEQQWENKMVRSEFRIHARLSLSEAFLPFPGFSFVTALSPAAKAFIFPQRAWSQHPKCPSPSHHTPSHGCLTSMCCELLVIHPKE